MPKELLGCSRLRLDRDVRPLIGIQRCERGVYNGSNLAKRMWCWDLLFNIDIAEQRPRPLIRSRMQASLAHRRRKSYSHAAVSWRLFQQPL